MYVIHVCTFSRYSSPLRSLKSAPVLDHENEFLCPPIHPHQLSNQSKKADFKLSGEETSPSSSDFTQQIKNSDNVHANSLQLGFELPNSPQTPLNYVKKEVQETRDLLGRESGI